MKTCTSILLVALVGTALCAPQRIPNRVFDDYEEQAGGCQEPIEEEDYVPQQAYDSGCDTGCDGGCDTGCDGGCDGGCDSAPSYPEEYDSGCDGGCDGGCDQGCDGGCDSGCDDATPEPQPVYDSGCDQGCDGGCDGGCDDGCDQGCDGGCDNGCEQEPTTESAPECAEPTTAPPSDCAQGDYGVQEAEPLLNAQFEMGMVNDERMIQRFNEFDAENDNADIEDCLYE